jgi:hypothetical protein
VATRAALNATVPLEGGTARTSAFSHEIGGDFPALYTSVTGELPADFSPGLPRLLSEANKMTTKKTPVSTDPQSNSPPEVETKSGPRLQVVGSDGMSDLYTAEALPNIDGRSSILNELPADLFEEDRGNFEIGSTRQPGTVAFGTPRDQEWVLVFPDPTRYRKLSCLKDKENRKLYPVTAALIAKYPKIARASRSYIVRQAAVLDKDEFLWPAPWPGGREYPGDQKQREAQLEAMKDWVQLSWTGDDWAIDNTEPRKVFPAYSWDKSRSFEEFLKLALKPITLADVSGPFLRRFLGLGPLKSP